VNSDYSIQVQNRNGSVVYSAPQATERYGALIISSADVSFLQAGSGAVVRTAQSKMRDVVSVKDFGAVGDGVADDTVAIQLFFNYINTSLGGATAGYTGTAGTRTAYIPAANYVISGPISLGAYLDVECDKRAMFTAAPGYTGVLFYCGTPYQIRWSGGIFQASANGVGGIWWMGNANYPTSPINLDQGYCVFENFEAKGFQDVFPVLVNRSAQMTIKNFKADRNIHLIGRGANLNTTTGAYSQVAPQSGYGGYADIIMVENGWITMSDLMSTDFDGVICADSIHTRDLLLVPVPHSGVECAWVNAWSYHTADKIRYGGEPGSIAPCNWMGAFSSSYPIVQTGVVITNSFIYNTDQTTTTLATGINTTDTTIVLTDGSKFPTNGELFIGTERINYLNRAGNTISADVRSSLGQSHIAGATVINRTSTIIRLFYDLPNFISVTGCSGGADMSSLVNYWYGMGAGFANVTTSSKSLAFKCFIKDNNLTTTIGDFGYWLTSNTQSVDYDRNGKFNQLSVTAGSPGQIRTVIQNITCARAKTYRVRVTVCAGANTPYEQSLEGVLSINRYFDGAAVVMFGDFTKTADINPPIGGAPSNIDIVDVKFIYPNGSVSVGNSVPIKDRFIVRPVIDLSASVGGVDSSGYAILELIP
jgi:hypothetical protein